MTGTSRHRLTVVGGGVAGLTAAVTAAEGGAAVTLYEAHDRLGGRARTADGPYRANEGPHALYSGGAAWAWLKPRGLLRPLAAAPLREAARFRFHRGGRLRRTPAPGLFRLVRVRAEAAPVDASFTDWATGIAGPDAARAAAYFSAVALFHHDPGALSARFVQERLRRVAALPPQAHFPRGGWGRLVDRMAARARDLGVVIETSARLDALPSGGGPVIVATSLDAARPLLGDDPSLTWPSGRTVLLDLALRRRAGDPYVVSDLDAPGWLERFTAQDPGLAPAGEQLFQGQFPIGPGQAKADGLARAEALLDTACPDWRDRERHRRTSVADGRTGAVDPPGATWRDRPAIDRGAGVLLAGDRVAAPGLLAEVAFASGERAAQLALRQSPSRA
ncbi:FAD-dependent oxidoreductase [Streptomyces solincola]|uniref:FAD-dependent oxidoreductase n=1 Tax=Streptomyces solincola TaxID=2100817 RepID=A0A2S9PR05_9ACTN|nr:FAD-dependent oxidoreductase [Streptomyces solincola]PRH76849.1 FAD-dependent oxidoreductase [Streptomyces solincola]